MPPCTTIHSPPHAPAWRCRYLYAGEVGLHLSGSRMMTRRSVAPSAAACLRSVPLPPLLALVLVLVLVLATAIFHKRRATARLRPQSWQAAAALAAAAAAAAAAALQPVAPAIGSPPSGATAVRTFIWVRSFILVGGQFDGSFGVLVAVCDLLLCVSLATGRPVRGSRRSQGQGCPRRPAWPSPAALPQLALSWRPASHEVNEVRILMRKK